MSLELDENGKIQTKIFEIFPDYHNLEDDTKKEILSALIQWASMEIYSIKNK